MSAAFENWLKALGPSTEVETLLRRAYTEGLHDCSMVKDIEQMKFAITRLKGNKRWRRFAASICFDLDMMADRIFQHVREREIK